jgi:hypothetical protein
VKLLFAIEILLMLGCSCLAGLCLAHAEYALAAGNVVAALATIWMVMVGMRDIARRKPKRRVPTLYGVGGRHE